MNKISISILLLFVIKFVFASSDINKDIKDFFKTDSDAFVMRGRSNYAWGNSKRCTVEISLGNRDGMNSVIALSSTYGNGAGDFVMTEYSDLTPYQGLMLKEYKRALNKMPELVRKVPEIVKTEVEKYLRSIVIKTNYKKIVDNQTIKYMRKIKFSKTLWGSSYRVTSVTTYNSIRELLIDKMRSYGHSDEEIKKVILTLDKLKNDPYSLSDEEVEYLEGFNSLDLYFEAFIEDGKKRSCKLGKIKEL